MKNILYFFKNLCRGLKNLWVWLPIIWKDRDFDYGYFLDMFDYKLQRMHRFFDNPDNVVINEVSRKNIVSRISTARTLLKKIYFDEEYSLSYLKEIEEIYGNQHMVFTPLKDKPHLSSLSFEYDKHYTEEEKEAIKEHERRLFFESNKKNAKAKRIFWQFINHNIEYWWD